jgi:hypothetical protein
MRKLMVAAAAAGMLGYGAVALGGSPYPRHPRLAAAADGIAAALSQLNQAKEQEKGEFGGHRERAEALLNQAQQQIRQAAIYSNAHMPAQKPRLQTQGPSGGEEEAEEQERPVRGYDHNDAGDPDGDDHDYDHDDDPDHDQGHHHRHHHHHDHGRGHDHDDD